MSTTSMGLLAQLEEACRTGKRLWRDFTGESAYDRYVERHAREHPGHAPMSERQFWRDRARFEEQNVSTGCC
ncbi:YbdD/YjiX family protein [Gleimia hominis]|uniref:YbdD/YjiX family protein n=1 Tax=Gleimia hominis TaxID=595468 RepID=UPI000C8038D7|nr:YbdD/YjiX family protein [Gleimia hominis]WIK63865.1 YbdD/YjiX family protein [Gleimia hominis]